MACSRATSRARSTCRSASSKAVRYPDQATKVKTTAGATMAAAKIQLSCLKESRCADSTEICPLRHARFNWAPPQLSARDLVPDLHHCAHLDPARGIVRQRLGLRQMKSTG